MSNKTLYILWGILYSICAGLGFIPEPFGAVRGVLTAVSILFFLPPAILLYRAGKKADAYTLKLIRNLALASLSLTLVLLVLNLLSAMQSEILGKILHSMLIVLSSPMVCSGYWVLSLFFWACLLMASLQCLKKK